MTGQWGFGSQCIVVAIDPKWLDEKWVVHINGGRVPTDKEAINWAKEVEDRGAGEILLTSMDRDGTKAGYNLEMTQAIAEAVSIPVIASGGAGKMEDFRDALTRGKATQPSQRPYSTTTDPNWRPEKLSLRAC